MIFTKISTIAIACALGLMLFPVTESVFAEEESDTRTFEYMAEKEISDVGQDGFFVLELQPDVFSTMEPSFRDLRLYADDTELGYAPLFLPQAHVENNVPLTILNRGMLEDGATYSFVLVMPERQGPNGAIMVRLDKEPYLVKGTLYGSQDNRNWQKVRSVTLFGIEGRYNEVPLSGMDYDYVKIEFAQPPEENLEAAESYLVTRQLENIEESRIDADFTVTENNAADQTVLNMDLKWTNYPSHELILKTREKGFYRKVRLEGSNDEKGWSPITSTFIYRGVDAGDEKLSLDYDTSFFRYLRVTMDNEDNPPISVDAVQLQTRPLKLLVKVPSSIAASSFRLAAYWGNETVQSPSYDVERWVNEVDIKNYSVVSIGQLVRNPDFDPNVGKPITERYPFLLPLGLVLAVVVVGFILFRNVKEIKKP